MRAALIAVLLLAPGCDRIFGLTRDEVPIDAAIDSTTGSELVTGRWRLVYTTNQVDGTPSIIEIPHPDGTLQVRNNGDIDMVQIGADGSFSFKRPAGAAYQLIRSSAIDGNPLIELQSDAAHVEIVSRLAGRYDRVPVTQPTTLTFSNNSLPGEHIIVSTGLWTESTIINSDMLDWQTAAPSGGPRGLLDATKNDRLWYLNRVLFADAAANPFFAFTAQASTSVSIADGVAQFVPIAPAGGLARDLCSRVVAKRVAALQRASAAAGANITLLVDDWVLQAVPAMSIGPVGTITVAFHGESTATPTDRTTDVQYNNPFPGHQVLGSLGAVAQRQLRHPTATVPTILPYGERVYVPAMPCPMTTTVEPFQGYPGSVSIDGVQIGQVDGADLSIAANRPVELSWTLMAPGPVDVSSVTIYTVASDSITTSLVPLMQYVTTARSVSIQPNILSPSDYYVIRIDATVGYPAAATGDFYTTTYPWSNATQWSRMFRVVIP